MSHHRSEITKRLSLRPPQQEALARLARICALIEPKPSTDLDAALTAIQGEYPSVQAFEREFPSLCFALATGVGKTRLMGAFIAYLYRTKRSRHFFVLAPNLTIYQKLIADFTPGTPKYVFQGLSEFVTAPPVVITGDNYESGVGVRDDVRLQPNLPIQGLRVGEDAVHINVFNISKFNKDTKGTKGAPRMRRLSEYIGESYFDYLAGLPDLVVLMDEAHRYRADAGAKAINDLRPILGLELTATPFVESTKGPVPFQNVVYSYSLAQAITDGFVKQPAVATRKDFDSKVHDKSKVERIKLEDGVRLHEQVKTDLLVYAAQHNKPVVKPFMLVVAEKIDHANQLVTLIQSEHFFEGRYADRVILVHSETKGEEKEETIQRLLAVEDPLEPTEIVVHVNMLKEGWDVTNLYTIVPLRTADARTLIEQSIGRGLRLPFGKRTGISAVDRLTIVSHDNFQAIVDEANRGGSILQQVETILLDADGADEPNQAVAVRPRLEDVLFGAPANEAAGATPTLVAAGRPAAPAPVFATPGEKALAQATLKAIAQQSGLPFAGALLAPEIQRRLVEAVRTTQPVQDELPGVSGNSIEQVVQQVTQAYVDHAIDLPAITLVPSGDVSFSYQHFDLATATFPRLQPVDRAILVHHLQSQERVVVMANEGGLYENRLEDYVVGALISRNDVHYDDNADLFYHLAGQVVDYLRSYLSREEDLRNVLAHYHARIGDLVYVQLRQHRKEHTSGYEVKVLAGHRPLVPTVFAMAHGESLRPFREPVDAKSSIAQMIFGGFSKCLYPLQKFHSDSERRLAVLLENEPGVTKWVKPARNNFQIGLRDGSQYEPDFVAVGADASYIIEVKRKDELQKPEVVAKAIAAAVWCHYATQHATDGKPWHYLLIPHDQISDNRSLKALAAEFEYRAPEAALVAVVGAVGKTA